MSHSVDQAYAPSKIHQLKGLGMPKIKTAINILRERGPLGLAKATVEWAARSVGVGVSFGSYRPIHTGVEGTPIDFANVFESIYKGNLWNSAESTSGPGSELAYTAGYRRELTAFLKEEKIASLFDAPCGDLNWIGEVINTTGIYYIGGDISQTAVKQAKQKRPELELRVFDICCDEFPNTDAWQCRDCLFHLSFFDIRRALSQFIKSGTAYALITTNTALYLRNVDIETGGCRYLDLERAPINLPKPIHYLTDFTRGKDFPRYVGVWHRQQISDALKDTSWGMET